MPSWDPYQYSKFEQARLQPAIDLINRIPEGKYNAVADLGCGWGNVTNLLCDIFPDAKIDAIDSSPNMIERAKREAHNENINYMISDINTWTSDGHYDLIFSNAALHWLKDHEILFPRLFSNLSQNGVFTIQMPNNFQEPTHTTIVEVVKSKDWSVDLEPYLPRQPVLPIKKYMDIFSTIVDENQISIWETIYYQFLEGEHAVFNWVKGSALRPFLDRLEGSESEDFENLYKELISHQYQKTNTGSTVLPFRRLFMVIKNNN